jgi:hypothetical protein
MTNEEQDQHDPHVVKLSNRQRMFLRDRLKALGFKSYRHYLLYSPAWQETKERYEASGRPQKCMVCHDPHYELHHRTYKRLGRELLQDLIPLCRDHHDQVHRQHEPLWNGHRGLRQRTGRASGGSRDRQPLS